jgi:type II secretory pathway pseudopilin PulG
MNEMAMRALTKGGKAGFTTIGMIVALLLLGLMLSPLLGTILSAQNGFVANRERARAAGNVRYAHLALTRFMRLAGSSPVGLPLPGIDPDPDGNGYFDDVRLRADYNPPDGDINDTGEDLVFFVQAATMYVRTGAGGTPEPYLIGVDSLAFEYYDRDGVLITDPSLVATHAISARLTIRARSERSFTPTKRLLSGEVRLRNGK